MPKDMQKDQTVQMPIIGRSAALRPDSVNEEERSVEIVWTTGAEVQRARFVGWDLEYYREELDVSSNALRLERMNSGAPFLNSHSAWNVGSVLGVIEEGSVRIEGGKGYARVRFSRRDDVEPIWRDVRDGILRHVSVGYKVHRYEITKQEGELDLWRAVDWEPFEVSAVAIPADAGSHVRSDDSGAAANPCVVTRSHDETAAAAALEKGTNMSKPNTPAAGQDEGRNVEAETRAAPATPEATPAPATAETRSAPQGDNAEVIAQRAVEQERARTTAISEMCRRHGLTGDFEATLLRDGASVEEARVQVLDQLAERDPLEGRSYEPAPAQARGESAGDVAYRDGLTAALMHRVNPGQNAMTDAAREFRGLSLLEMARTNLERRGVSTRGMSRMEVAEAVFSRAAGYHSTADFPIILGNLANRTLRDAYEGIPRTFQAFSRREVLTDFKPVTRAQLSGAPDLEKVLESGEFTYGTMGESSETYALSTYGRIIGFTRQMLVNDDMSAFTRMAAAFGARASELEGDIVYAILTTNPDMGDGTALFHADHGNLGSAAVINETALTAAMRAYATQTGIEGHRISVSPAYILVPPGQRAVEARKLLTATTPDSTANVNVYASSLQVVEDRRLIPASGQDPWFLSAQPSLIDTIEYAYLEGQDGVHTETRMGFEVDGLEIKARHDFAAKAIDWRGLYKNPGASPS